MKETVKKTKFFIGLALLAQSFTFIAFFFALWRKKRSLAGTFLAIGAAGGISGAYLVYKNHKEIQREQKILAAMDAFCEDTDDYIFDDEWVDLRDQEPVADESAPENMDGAEESAK